MVPLFQRPYTWGEKQWKTLWEDIVDFYDLDPSDQRSTHFMGAIVTMPARSVPVGVSKFLVIDGQQRLTTIAILMCAIRDALKLEPNEPAYRRIQTHYLTNEGYPGTDHLKLLPTQSDRPSFAPLIESPELKHQGRASAKRMNTSEADSKLCPKTSRVAFRKRCCKLLKAD